MILSTSDWVKAEPLPTGKNWLSTLPTIPSRVACVKRDGCESLMGEVTLPERLLKAVSDNGGGIGVFTNGNLIPFTIIWSPRIGGGASNPLVPATATSSSTGWSPACGSVTTP